MSIDNMGVSSAFENRSKKYKPMLEKMKPILHRAYITQNHSSMRILKHFVYTWQKIINVHYIIQTRQYLITHT